MLDTGSLVVGLFYYPGDNAEKRHFSSAACVPFFVF